jgi:Ni/Co efflux regulator RcnB
MQGRQEYTATPATASAGGCSRRPALPRGPFSPPLAKQKAPRKRDESTSPSGGDPQVSFAHRYEDGGLRDGVGAKVVQLHPIVVQDRPHEAACRHTESPLVERDEAHDVPRRQGRSGSTRGGIHSGCLSSERGRSKPSATRSSRSSAVIVEKGHWSRGETMVTRSAITEQKGWRRKGLGRWFPFLWLNLSGCENLRRR